MSDFVQASARTSVLTNSCLLHFVFLYLWSDYPGRFKLARCATVCREFHEPVIRILWKELEGLFPLWHLLAPQDTKCPKRYSFFDKPEIDRAHYLHRVITLRLYEDPAVWKRFLWHAIHVRHITYNTDTGNDQSKIHAAHLVLMQNLLMKNGEKTFLPLLQSIRWNVISVPIDKSFVPFFTSTLRCATMTLESDDEEVHALLLHRMQNASPHLLDPSHPYAYAIPVDSDAIHYIHTHCPHLQELQMYSIRLPVVGVHAIPAPLDRSAQSESSPPHALRRLWTEGVWVYRSKYHAWGTEHTEAFARYFLELFPAVDHVEEYREYREQVRQAGWGQRNIARPAKDGMELLVCMYQYGRSEARTSRAPN